MFYLKTFVLKQADISKSAYDTCCGWTLYDLVPRSGDLDFRSFALETVLPVMYDADNLSLLDYTYLRTFHSYVLALQGHTERSTDRQNQMRNVLMYRVYSPRM